MGSSSEINFEEVKRHTLKVVSQISEKELETVTLPILREKVAESMDTSVDRILGKEFKMIIMETFQEFLLSREEKKVEEVEEKVEEQAIEDPQTDKPKKSTSKPKKSEVKSTKDKGESKDNEKMDTKHKANIETESLEAKSSKTKDAVKSESPIKSSKTTTMSAKAAQIEKLKSYVFKCGVRKVWKKEFEGLNENQCITKLQNILKDLGMEGKPSLEQCKAIKAKREFEAELKEIDTSNIIEGKRRKTMGSLESGPVASVSSVVKRTVILSESESDDQSDVVIDLKAFGDSESD